ncbi:hypothetical protein [Methanoculleus chikugoensis]|uniref:hypothetical protein n=1 Tax=Methanoculleus chikugoensis TaxID=118126 RepID=UPI000B0D2B3A|nr:hypothetical protein [Methanoculleus chikugoensis]
MHVRILAVNDFHGQIPPDGQKLNGEPAGSAPPVLASYLRSAAADDGGTTTFIALPPGDAVGGASPPESGLLLDEPAVLFFNGLADDYPGGMIATFGNHEFDRGGTDELLRMVRGGNGTAPPRPPGRPPTLARRRSMSPRTWSGRRTAPSLPPPLHHPRCRRCKDRVHRRHDRRDALDPEGDQHRGGSLRR